VRSPTPTDHCNQRYQRAATYFRADAAGMADGQPNEAALRNRLIVGDALSVLRTTPSGLVDCVITSPPYFLLRNYGIDNQIGAESNVDQYVERIVAVCDQIGRVLKPTGSLWLNLGDSYSRHDRYGTPAKSLLLAPERILLALAESGWVVRNKVVWSKPNPMPSSVRDRLTCSWEPLYLLVRSPRYYFDLDAIRLPHTTSRRPSRESHTAKYAGGKRPAWAGQLAGANDGLIRAHREGRSGHPLGKNPTDVWTLPTAGFRGAHFATFPVGLVERPLRATCPKRVCRACGTPWRRSADKLRADCVCQAGWQPGLVLDPFMGAGTVAVAAQRVGRDWLGIELNAEYAAMAEDRLTGERDHVAPDRLAA
jgi:site-specific DNA-methyltransferase (adenine-specific)